MASSVLRQVQPVLAFAATHLEEELPLATLAAQAGLSAFHLHRIFAAAAGETPKQFTLRLRLGRAAAMLLTAEDSVLSVALACGFQSHEGFCRAFRRRFGMTPSAYRRRGLAAGIRAPEAREHAAVVNQVGPCVALYRISNESRSKENGMTYSVTKQVIAPQPVLVVRRTVKRSEIASTIGEVLPRVFQYAQQSGIPLVGPPFARYVEVGPGLLTIEPGMRVAAAGVVVSGAEVVADTLPGGPVAVTTHVGPYDQLHEAYVALEEWMKAEGLKAGGAPWESYVTDPADFPDPADWKTEVFWPLAV